MFLRCSFVVSGAFFQKCIFPEWLAKENSQNCKIPKCSNLIDLSMVLPMSICKFVQQTSTMHLNTSPNCFEGSGTGKHKTKTLKHLKLVVMCVYHNRAMVDMVVWGLNHQGLLVLNMCVYIFFIHIYIYAEDSFLIRGILGGWRPQNPRNKRRGLGPPRSPNSGLEGRD